MCEDMTTDTHSDSSEYTLRKRKACPVCGKLRLIKHARSNKRKCMACGWLGEKCKEVQVAYKGNAKIPKVLTSQLTIESAKLIQRKQKAEKVKRVSEILAQYLTERRELGLIYFNTKNVIPLGTKGGSSLHLQHDRRIITEIIRDTALLGGKLLHGFEIQVHEQTRSRKTYVAIYKGDRPCQSSVKTASKNSHPSKPGVTMPAQKHLSSCAMCKSST